MARHYQGRLRQAKRDTWQKRCDAAARKQACTIRGGRIARSATYIAMPCRTLPRLLGFGRCVVLVAESYAGNPDFEAPVALRAPPLGSGPGSAILLRPDGVVKRAVNTRLVEKRSLAAAVHDVRTVFQHADTRAWKTAADVKGARSALCHRADGRHAHDITMGSTFFRWRSRRSHACHPPKR